MIGKPLSPYAISKYVNELHAENFSQIYGIETIGLRYFNVFGRRQDPSGAYTAVIPKFIMSLMKHESPVINVDGSYSRDFTYVKNVVQANQLALITTKSESLNTVYNVACGEQTNLKEMFGHLRSNLAEFDCKIASIEPEYGKTRMGDIPHSLADISKARLLLGYNPLFNFQSGISEATKWYWENITTN